MDKINQLPLYLRHYSHMLPLKCTVVSGDLDNFFTTKTQDVSELNSHVIKGDPVIFGTLVGSNDIKISGGHIISINENDMKLIISPDKVILDVPEKREIQRFPVSVLGYLKQKDCKKGYYIYVKDMSYLGIKIYSTAELVEQDMVQIDLYLQDNVLNFEGSVIWKSTCYHRFEYGIQFIHRNRNSLYSIRDNIDRLINSEKRLLMKHLIR